MNISITAGGFTAVSTGILLIMVYPFFYTSVTLLSVIIGLLTGGVFGMLFDYQTALTGYVNGLMMGLMGPMVGALIENQLLFLFFFEFILLFAYVTVVFSVRRS
nr:MnxA [Bacillus sp. (in: firmicutes)]